MDKKFVRESILRFEGITYTDEDFSNRDFSSQIYQDCEFKNCNLSNVTVKETRFQEVIFKGCRILGVIFTKCNPFLLSMRFEDCHISCSAFSELKLVKTNFFRCQIHDTDFINTDLTEADFDGSDLERTIFYNCNLSFASFVSASNYQFDPHKNILKKTKLSFPGAISLLYVFDVIIQ
jgi:fluoroquinolone resistance protein